MFGTYRYGLAFCVAISHMWGNMIGGPAAYAVWGFYALSGYLMTLVLNEKYGFSPRGVARFAANRALRIYPAYYVVCLGMFLLFYFAPGGSARFLPNLTMPRTFKSWLFSLTLLTKSDGGELLHGSAALRVEMWYYIAMALGLARSRRISTAWFAASVAYTAWLLKRDTPFAERYVFIAACSLPFSVGAMVYHWREKLPVIRSPWAAVAAAAIWWLHVWFGLNIKGGPWIYGLYTSLAVSVFAMITLMNQQARSLPPRLVALDRLLGNLSYPIYLCHWGVGIVVTMLAGLTRPNINIFYIGFPIVNIVAYTIYRYIEEPLAGRKLATSPRQATQPIYSSNLKGRPIQEQNAKSVV